MCTHDQCFEYKKDFHLKIDIFTSVNIAVYCIGVLT